MAEPLRILAVGNSFSVDTMQYLAQIANELNTPVILGNLYIGGCSLQRHYDNTFNLRRDYTYYKTTDGDWSALQEASITDGLLDEPWDIITMQQASGYSGAPETYTCLPQLIDYIRKQVPCAKLVWHMTWAYQSDSTHKHFPRYQSNQLEMYHTILACIDRFIRPSDVFGTIIPTGTAIQNARSGFIGDTLTRDGFHLSYTTGRLLGAMTWYAALFGRPLSGLTFNPAPDEITPALMQLLKASAEAAVAAPFCVTPQKSDQHLEIERKWLIVPPDTKLLTAIPGAERIQITQTYLVEKAGESSRRVRAAQTADGNTIYTQTVKRRISTIVAEEDEREISRAEYLALLAEADPTCRPIEKVRWRIPCGRHILEIDVYPFWTEQAVLEIELPSTDTDVSLPEWLTVIREVSGDRSFSNHHLAKNLPAFTE